MRQQAALSFQKQVPQIILSKSHMSHSAATYLHSASSIFSLLYRQNFILFALSFFLFLSVSFSPLFLPFGLFSSFLYCVFLVSWPNWLTRRKERIVRVSWNFSPWTKGSYIPPPGWRRKRTDPEGFIVAALFALQRGFRFERIASTARTFTIQTKNRIYNRSTVQQQNYWD